jgi:hypothetical protein
MSRITIAIVVLSVLIGFFSIYIGIQSLHNMAQMENIHQMFAEDEEVNLEELYYYHESINAASGAISTSAWIIVMLTLINCAVGCYLFFKSKKVALK